MLGQPPGCSGIPPSNQQQTIPSLGAVSPTLFKFALTSCDPSFDVQEKNIMSDDEGSYGFGNLDLDTVDPELTAA